MSFKNKNNSDKQPMGDKQAADKRALNTHDTSLAQLQQALKHWILSRSDNVPSPVLTQLHISDSQDQSDIDERLAIYRNNTFKSLCDALLDLYPSLIPLLGEDFVRACMQQFISEHPPTSAALIDYGNALPHFLQTFEHTQKFQYLPQLCQIDLYRHSAYHAQDHLAMTADMVDMQTLGESRVEFCHAFHLIRSPFAIFDLWQHLQHQLIDNNAPPQDSQHDDMEHIDLQRAQSVVISRKNMAVTTHLVHEDFAELLQDLSLGLSFNTALEQSLERNPNFDLSGAVGELFSQPYIHTIIANT